MKFKSLYSIIFCIVITLVGCKKKERSEERPLRVNFLGSPTTFDSRKASDLITASLQFYLNEGLTRMIPSQTASLGLAKHIEISPDGKTYTFHIRETYWTHGDPLTSYDFKRAWLSILDPDFPCANAFLLYPIDNAREAKLGQVPLSDVGIETPNAHTLIVHLRTPTPYFLEVTSFCTLFPIPSQSNTTDLQHCSLGPYKVAEYENDQHILLKKNPLYWDADNVTLNAIDISLVKEETTAYRMYELGQLDFIGMPFSCIPSDVIHSLGQNDELHSQQLTGTAYCTLNLMKKPFNNFHFRKAIAHAINRDALIDHIALSNGSTAQSLLPPTLTHPSSNKIPEFNPSLAKHHFALFLEEENISIADLNQIELTYPSQGLFSKMAPVIQEQIASSLHFMIKLKPTESRMLIATLMNKDYDMALTTTFAQYFDPMNILERFINKTETKNFCSWENPEYKALLEQSYCIENLPYRNQILSQAETVLLNDLPIIPLYHPHVLYLAKHHIMNLQSNPTGGIYFNQVTLSL